MAAFEYQALDTSGRKRKGVISADSQKAARRELRKQALTPLKLAPTRDRKSEKPQASRRRLDAKELVLLTRQLALLITSGLPIEEAIHSVGQSAKKAETRTVLASVRAGVVEGQSMSDAMAGEPRTFTPLYRAVVSAGEEAGSLGSVLERLAEHLEKAQAVRRKVTAALIYPVILACVALSVIIGLLVFVVPRVVEQFDTLDQSLPVLTEIMIGLSDLLVDWGLILIGLFVGGGILFNRLMTADGFRRQVHGVLLSLPIVGNVLRAVSAARFARTFGTLANAGATVPDCLAAARETTPNLVVRDAVDEVMNRVREGGSLNGAMAATGAFPPLMVNLAASGEAGGNLGAMFDKGADYLEADFDATTTLALGMLEPLITVFMGGLVMLIILAIMLPILQLNTGAAFG